MTERSMDELIELTLTERRRQRFAEVAAARLCGITAVFERFADLYNVSACLRSAESFGVGEVHIVTDERYKSSRKVSGAASRWLTVQRHRDPVATARELRDRGYSLVGTVCDRDAVPFDQLEVPPKLALIMGNEHGGIEPGTREMCAALVTIPAHGFTQSLNVSVAFAILMRHYAAVFRRRGAAGHLSPAARDQLVRAWCEREVRHKMGMP